MNTFKALLLLLLVSSLIGCGGTKVLKESQPVEVDEPIASVSDRGVTAALDWVIVRDGPGTWARNASWDEYLLRVSNQSNQKLQVIELAVIDTLDARIESRPGRQQLTKASKKTAKRYKKAGMKLSAGSGTRVLPVAGATAAGAAVGAASMAGTTGIMAGSGVGAVAGATVVLVPAVAVGGVMRGLRNRDVNHEIERRQTVLPIDVAVGEVVALDVFFPLAPSPHKVELTYADSTGEHVMVLDTSAALNGLHLPWPARTGTDH